MEAKLYGQNKGGMSINGIIKNYYAYAGEKISAGDLVEYVNGVAGKTDYGESVDTQLSTEAQTGYAISAVQLDESRVFIAHSKGTNYFLYGIVVTIDGATITAGTDILLQGSLNAGHCISTVLLENGDVFVAHSSGGNYYLLGIVCSISGTTITKGTDTVLINSANAGYKVSACLLDNGNIFIAHSYGSSYYLYGVVCSVDGTTITAGTDTALVSSSNAGYTISTCLLPNGNVFIAHSYNSSNYYLYGIVCSISDTTISKGSDTQISSVVQSGYAISTCLLPNGNVFIAHSGTASYILYAVVVSIDDTTITAGTDKQIINVQQAGAELSTCLLSNGNVMVVHSQSAEYDLHAYVFSIEGTTIKGFGDVILHDNSDYTGYVISALTLNNGSVFIAHSLAKNFYYLYAQIYAVGEDNKTTNNISIIEYETQIRQVTTGQFDGIAKTSGLGGDDTGHKDIVSIWTKVKEVIPEGTQQVAMADGK